jgi:hypothetical protein
MRPYRTEAGATIEDRPGKHTIFGKVEKSFIVALSKILRVQSSIAVYRRKSLKGFLGLRT